MLRKTCVFFVRCGFFREMFSREMWFFSKSCGSLVRDDISRDMGSFVVCGSEGNLKTAFYY